MGDQTKTTLMLILILITITAVEGSEETLEVVNAKEILAKLQNGTSVEYDHVIIEGDLDLNQLNLSKVHINRPSYDIEILGLSENAKLVTSSIAIKNATINGRVNFGNAVFYSPVDFSGSNFTDFAQFHGAVFSVYSNVYSDISKYSGYAYFDKARFNNGADFRGANGPVRFMHARFNGITFFKSAQLYYPDFSNAQFIGVETDFRKARFIGITSFSEAQFSNSPFFTEAQFNGDTYFRGTKFSDRVSFSAVQFNEDIDFTYVQFGGDVSLNDARFKGYIIGWNNLQDFIKCDEVTYLTLIENLKDHGQFNTADDCYFAYRLRYMSGPLDFLSLISCGYGVRPQYPIYWSIFFISFFGIIYWIGEAVQRSVKRDYVITYASDYKNQPGSLLKKFFTKISKKFRGMPSRASNLSLTDALHFSLMIFFVSHPPTDWRPSDEWKWWKYLIMVEDILGWILMTLFVVTLTHVMIHS